jgi:16S rRNA (cytidine1402-2'-O)-methyltransferase
MKGKLYLVSTPIGNLKDITLRALEVLGEVDLIAAEDTRRTRVLLKKYDVKNPVVSYHDRNKRTQAGRLVESMKSGKDCALVSDSGTPGIQDPGYQLVRLAIDEGIDVTAIPGPSALLAAAVVSGLPIDRFVFEGYLPRRKGRRRKRLEDLRDETRTTILFESPHRVKETLSDILEILGNRDCVVGRELTKMFEEIVRDTVSGVLSHCSRKGVRGEYVILVRGRGELQ